MEAVSDGLVSFDGRCAAACPAGTLKHHRTLYAAEPDWQDLLTRICPDAILTRVAAPLLREVSAGPG